MRERPPRASFTYSTFWATVSASPISRAPGKRKCENNQKASAKERVWVRMTMPSSAASVCGQRRRTREAVFSTGRHKTQWNISIKFQRPLTRWRGKRRNHEWNWSGLECRRLPCQALAPLLSFVSHLLTMRSNRKPDVVALEPYNPKRLHQSSVCRIEQAMTRL